MSFSQELIKEAQPFLESIKKCDFIQGVLDNNLDPKALDYYVSQDLQYGNTETIVQAYLIIYSDQFTDQKDFAKLLSDHLGIDEDVFEGMTDEDWDTIKTAKMEPVTYLYTHHLLDPIKTRNAIEILAPFEAGVWVYVELIKYLASTNKVTKDNPFHGWLDCLEGDDYQQVSDGFLAVMDREAEKCSPEKLAEIKESFLRSCMFEWYFFDASFKQTTWADWNKNVLENQCRGNLL